MKNRSYHLFSLGCLMLGLITISSCRKFIEIPPPANSIVTSQIFADSANATAAINGIYINIMGNGNSQNLANSASTIFGGLSADELENPSNSANFRELLNNTVNPTNATNLNFWVTAYGFIYQANACIDGVAQSTTISNTLRDRITGEALFLRAFLHFYLLNFYGPVPIVTSTDYRMNSVSPRSSESEVYLQIYSDLNSARQLLSADPASINKTRVNRFAVGAFLARVNLYRQRWADAERESTAIIGSNYRLEPNLANIFLTGNQEQIWQMTPVAPGIVTTEGITLIPATNFVAPNYTATASLLSSFETGDRRRTSWFNSFTLGATTYTYVYKYKLTREVASPPRESYSALRLAEQYLIRSEARAQLGNLTGAVDDLNVIRNRSGLPNTNATTQADILAAIARERRVELSCEWGHRWLDLKRTGTVGAVLAYKPSWKATAALLPIPYTQTLLNPFLTQNPGY